METKLTVCDIDKSSKLLGTVDYASLCKYQKRKDKTFVWKDIPQIIFNLCNTSSVLQRVKIYTDSNRMIPLIMIYTFLYSYRCIRVTWRTSSSIKLKSKYMLYIVNCIVFWKLSRTYKLCVAQDNKTFKTQFTSG